MKLRPVNNLETPIASLIDVVFLLIIFFVVTADVDQDALDESIRLAETKHVAPAPDKDPRRITINVRRSGRIGIGRQRLNPAELRRILTATVAQSGNTVPVILRCDAAVRYEAINRILKIVGDTGLYRIQLATVPES